jgi:FAD/FMN-containing dehydrogenase/Fe-S oxidoreductase
VTDLAAALRRAGLADVDDSTLARALYSSDASIHRVVPQVVVRPRHGDELEAILTVARETGTPVTMRGAGTSIAGNAIGPGMVVDTSRHLDRIIDLDPEARTAVVEPGVVLSSLQRAAAPHGLRFGPDPSTHNRCTIGGMIGNNACGSRALGHGRTSDNVLALDTVGFADPDLTELVDSNLAHLRTAFGTFGRQISGYSLEHLLPEHGRDVARFLVGSEGTLRVVRQATLRLVAEPKSKALVLLGFPGIADAADAVPALLALDLGEARLTALEGFDARLLDVVRAQGRPVAAFPAGSAWAIAELAADQAAAVREAAAAMVASDVALATRIVEGDAEQASIWKIREDGAGLAARSLARPAYSGWEDAAVPPARLGAYLRDFEALMREHGVDGVPYGHFGDGCVHLRIDFDFGQGRYRRFVEASARLVASYGGSLSGEHGDGRARSELLPLMYDETSLALFRAVKHAHDPDNLLNPGVLVDPAPLDAELWPTRPVHSPVTALRLTHDTDLGAAVHRCTGVGKCRSSTAGVMCPSYLATRDEKDSTRGRARVLQEALDGSLVAGLRDPAVAVALDLCLSCKGCSSDCPTGVDMATYKAEVLHQQYDGRRRPRSHYTLGRLPHWVRRMPPGLMNLKAGQRLAKAIAGVDQRRSLPRVAARSLRETWSRDGFRDARWHSLLNPSRKLAPRPSVEVDVWIWADTFTDHFTPDNGRAAIELLSAIGVSAAVIPEDACCGLTWITTGQLTQAQKIMAATVATLHPYVRSGVPVIGLEPSCLAALRGDAVELTDDPRAAEVASGMKTLAEFLGTRAWTPPDLTGTTVVVQPHCHHHSVLGWAADEALLRSTGATIEKLDGCCGLAGNFGMEKGHYEVSVAVAETHLLPALREHPGAVVLADGLSCRHQIDDLTGRPAIHLARLLADRIRP